MRFLSLARRLGLLALLAASTAACSSAPDRPTGPTAEEIELQNVKTSLNMVRHALREMADDRDRFQDLYLSADQELAQNKGDAEFFESRVREQLALVQAAERRSEQLEAELGQSRSSAAATTGSLASAQAERDALADRLDTIESDRDELKRQVVDLQAANSKLMEEAAIVSRERDSLRSELASIGGQLRNGEENAAETQQSLARTVNKLEAELEQLRPLKVEVDQLRVALTETEEAKRLENERRLAAERNGSAGVVAAAGSEDVRSYMTALAQRSVDEIKRGEFNADNLSFLGAVVLLAVVALVGLVISVRGRRLRKRLNRSHEQVAQLQGQLRNTTPAAVTRPTARTITAPPELVNPTPSAPEPTMATQPMPSIEPAPLPSHVPEPSLPMDDVTQMMSPPSAGLGNLGEMTEFIDPGATEDLGDIARMAREQQAQAEADPASDDDLLRDLQRVIDKKLAN